MYDSQEMESTKMFINRKIRTNWYSPTWEWHSAKKHCRILALAAARIHQESIKLSEVGQSERDKLRKISWTESTDSHR